MTDAQILRAAAAVMHGYITSNQMVDAYRTLVTLADRIDADERAEIAAQGYVHPRFRHWEPAR